MGATITFIKTIAGNIFGGFTSLSWNESDGWKNDP